MEQFCYLLEVLVSPSNLVQGLGSSTGYFEGHWNDLQELGMGNIWSPIAAHQ